MTSPSPQPAKTITLMPTATATVTVTATPSPAPPLDNGDSLNDYLQGWGTVLAVVAALVVAVWTQRKADKAAAADRSWAVKQREKDRKDADRRLGEQRADAERQLLAERGAADRRLQQQLDAQRERERRDFLTEQLERLATMYAESSAQGHPPLPVRRVKAVLPMLPPHFATLLKVQLGGREFAPAVVPDVHRLAARIAEEAGGTLGSIDDPWIFQELADNIRELFDGKSRNGPTCDE